MSSLEDGVAERHAVLEGLMRSAGERALAGFHASRSGGTMLKGPQDYLTETDAAVERHIRGEIARLFPQDGFIGEEEGGTTGDFLWIADPIDGTANFARGNPHFCVSLALVAQGETRAGAIYAPVADELWIARRGHGASRNGRRLQVAATTDPAAATVEFGWSPRSSNEGYLAVVSRLLDLGTNIRRTGSGALGIAYVADGRQDGYAELFINAWDCLAGLLLVEEAGGLVNDFLADDGLSRGNRVIAVAPGIADRFEAATGIPLRRGGGTGRSTA